MTGPPGTGLIDFFKTAKLVLLNAHDASSSLFQSLTRRPPPRTVEGLQNESKLIVRDFEGRGEDDTGLLERLAHGPPAASWEDTKPPPPIGW
eukprot:9502838-Pyramimonas_sp.AAC.1